MACLLEAEAKQTNKQLQHWQRTKPPSPTKSVEQHKPNAKLPASRITADCTSLLGRKENQHVPWDHCRVPRAAHPPCPGEHLLPVPVRQLLAPAQCASVSDLPAHPLTCVDIPSPASATFTTRFPSPWPTHPSALAPPSSTHPTSSSAAVSLAAPAVSLSLAPSTHSPLPTRRSARGQQLPFCAPAAHGPLTCLRPRAAFTAICRTHSTR